MQNNMLKHAELCNEVHELYKRKNQDYGDSFHDTYVEYGLIMLAIRLEDKLKRFKKLIKSEAQVKDESIRDTLIDLSNYSLMGIMELDEIALNETESNGEGRKDSKQYK